MIRSSTIKLLAKVIPGKERRFIALLMVGFVVSGVLETIGVASIGPFLAVLVDPVGASSDKYLGLLYQFFEPETNAEFVLWTGGIVMLFLSINNIFLSLMTWMTSKFVFYQQHRLSKTLLMMYLSRPYIFFLERNTSDMIKNIFLIVHRVVADMLLPGLQAIARLIVTLFILGLLTYMDPILALIVGGAVAGFYITIYGSFRKYLESWGVSLTKAEQGRTKVATEALAGIRELKLSNSEGYFGGLFEAPSRLYAKTIVDNELLATLPRNALEVVAFAALLFVTAYLYQRSGHSAVETLPLVAMYAFGALRLMPAIQLVFSGITRFNFNYSALEILAKELDSDRLSLKNPIHSEVAQRGIDLQRMIEIRNLRFSYSDSDEVLHGLNMIMKKGQSIGIVGSSGSGKSTFVDILLGLLQQKSGEIVIDGNVTSENDLRKWRTSIGYVSQSIFLLDSTIADNIAFGVAKNKIDINSVKRAAEHANIHSFIETLPEKFNTVVGERGVKLSGGQRQRLAIARAFYKNPSVLILDEATNALDQVTELAITKAINEFTVSKTLIMVAHRISTIKRCDQIFVFDRGSIVGQGNFDDLMRVCPKFKELVLAGEERGIID